MGWKPRFSGMVSENNLDINFSAIIRWITEKLDGVRGYWNGKELRSRHAKNISYPSWFIEQLPKKIALDGELWMGRGTFEILNSILNTSETDNPSWKNISFMIFDLPSSKEPYEDRMRVLERIKLPRHALVVERRQCRGKDHLHECLVEILRYGGEGLMVNKPNSAYISQRTDFLLKVKVFIGITYSNIEASSR
jgi:DNA ligase-1